MFHLCLAMGRGRAASSSSHQGGVVLVLEIGRGYDDAVKVSDSWATRWTRLNLVWELDRFLRR